MIIINNCCILEENILPILKSEYDYFLSKPNVVGIGLGYKRKNTFYTPQKCIQVFVKNKIQKFKLPTNSLIPSSYKGIPTDVIESGVFRACSLTERKRPLVGGYGISSINYNEFGSIGCLVTNGVSKFLLSVNHVIAGENEFIMSTPITQPAYIYGGKHPHDTVGTLNRYVPLRFIKGTSRPINFSDCALGLLSSPNILHPEIALIGRLKGIKKSVKLNEEVHKVGCGSELTHGNVLTVHASATVNLPSGKRAFFHDLILTTEMTTFGDSGSILVNKANYGVGMSFSSTANISAFCYLNTVLDQLGVHLVT